MESLAHEIDFEAEYQLESPVRCSECRVAIDVVLVVRLLRKKVNFTSSLPRRGYIVVCPKCNTVIPAAIGGRTV